jgi:hypothetical protein
MRLHKNSNYTMNVQIEVLKEGRYIHVSKTSFIFSLCLFDSAVFAILARIVERTWSSLPISRTDSGAAADRLPEFAQMLDALDELAAVPERRRRSR